jgi:hypothetical protein
VEVTGKGWKNKVINSVDHERFEKCKGYKEIWAFLSREVTRQRQAIR